MAWTTRGNTNGYDMGLTAIAAEIQEMENRRAIQNMNQIQQQMARQYMPPSTWTYDAYEMQALRELLSGGSGRPESPITLEPGEVRQLQATHLKKDAAIPQSPEEKQWRLAVDMAKRLGYMELVKSLAPKKLAETLYLLDICPLSEKSVEKYKGELKKTMDEKKRQAGSSRPVNHQWVKTDFKSHGKPIPQNIAETAIKVLNELPEAQVYIEEIRDLDPFLIVEFYGAKKYIGVWDEPTFNVIESQLESE